MADIGRVLGGAELFRGFGDQAVEAVAAQATTVQFDRNELVFEQGDEAADLYVVSGGIVAITRRAPDGRESVLALMECGDLFGDMSLWDAGRRSADARVLEPTELVRIPYPALRAVLDDHPALLWEVVAFLSRRLRTTDAVLADAAFLDVPGRTAKRLLDLAGGHDDFVLPVTQEELAGMVGASRERVNKAISTFARLGWITQSERRYAITNRAELERRSR